MSKEIISLAESSPNIWKAKYDGNFGIYSIRIQLDDHKLINYSCSCPSDYDPCKHIGFILTAIEKRLAESVIKLKGNEPSVEEIIKNVLHNDLREFVIKLAKNNPELQDTIQLEFLHKFKKNTVLNYNEILRKALLKVSFNYQDQYGYVDGDTWGLDILDEWFAKARDFINNNQFNQAIAICKACIEEYATWFEETDSETLDFMDPIYIQEPFIMLIEIAKNPLINAEHLFQYGINEMEKSKYQDTDILLQFNDFLSQLITSNEQAELFLALQDKQLMQVSDKGSYKAEVILERKFNFYQNNNNPEKARQILEQNIKISSFRKKIAELLISEKKYDNAKKIILDYLASTEKMNMYGNSDWTELLLKIAQKTHDIAGIRNTSKSFLENHFESKYYRIYKSTFKGDSWTLELPKWINRYKQNNKWFSIYLADLYVEEKDYENLLSYMSKHVAADVMVNYYTFIVKKYPTETLQLFKIAIDKYLEENTGRNHYEYITTLFLKILRIEGGSEMLKSLILLYIAKYKNRKALVEIFKNFNASNYKFQSQ